MERLSALSMVAAMVAALAFASPIGAQMNDTDPDQSESKIPTITVSGSGEIRVPPDEAVVRLGVLSQQVEAAAAQEKANRIAAGILAGVEALGVSEEAVQTSRLVLSPVYSQPPPQPQVRPGEPRIIAYRASNVVSVRLEDLAKIGPAIDVAIEAGANKVEGVEFRLQDDLEARQRALTKAVQEAEAKAQAIAGALGVELGPVLDAREGGISIDVPRFGGGPQVMMMETRSAQPTPVSAGDITVSATVTLRYRIGGPGR